METGIIIRVFPSKGSLRVYFGLLYYLSEWISARPSIVLPTPISSAIMPPFVSITLKNYLENYPENGLK